MAVREPRDKNVRQGADASRPDRARGDGPRPALQSVDRVRAAEETAAALRIEVDELADRSERLRARVVAAEREAVLLSEHLTTKSALAGELRAGTLILREELDVLNNERATFVDQLGAARAQLDGRQVELDAARGRHAALELDLQRVRSQLARHEGRLAELETILESAHRERDDALRQLDTAHTSIAALTTDLAASVAATSAASADLEAAREEAAQLRSELAGTPTGAELVIEGEAVSLTQQLADAQAAQQQSDDALSLNQQLLASTEQTRDRYAQLLKATAPTTLGRLAYRWQQYAEKHPRRARLLKAPFEAAWKVLTLRWPGWVRQHPLFDKAYYEEAHGDVAGGRLRPWWHYVRHGIPEGRPPNRYFDRSWYLSTYPDVAVAGFDPLDHYYRRGCWEGRDPGPRFSSDWYLAQHPEVAASGTCPLLHFITAGAAAGYAPAPDPSSAPRSATVGASRAAPRSTPARAPAPSADPRVVRPVSASAAPAPMAATSPVGANVKAIRNLVRAKLPADARLGVVSDGNDELLALTGATITPVPRGADGARAADVPRNEISAVAHIESLRAAHIDYLLAPQPSLWLTAVPGLLEYLDGRYARRSGPNSDAHLWDLRAPVSAAGTAGKANTEDLLGGLRDRIGSEPSILDWGAPVPVARIVPTATVFTPQDSGDVLRYADDSIDAVVFDGRSVRASEARRVAKVVTVAVSAEGAAPQVEWLGGEAGGSASVSIIIPTYRDATMVAGCLRTLAETVPSRLQAEFIVADDGSSAEIVSALEALVAAHPRARLVRNEQNGGYIAAVSSGAAVAQHDVLVFLNNDTVLLPGWLEPLLETFVQHPSCGVVGGMLLYPDGRLQEAGCAIFRDGSATKIGYGDTNPSLPYYAHPRPVDYVSGALLATPKALFDELGGLDEAYGFGYYEDGDYCFKARRAGRDVIYQPASRVVHVEGGTAGLDLTQGPKAFQARNQALFVERWQHELDLLPVRPEPLDLHASRDLVIRGSADHSGP